MLPKKVCIVGISLAVGGAERSMATLSKMLSESLFEVHVAILKDQIDFQYSGTLLNLGKTGLLPKTFLNRFFKMLRLRSYIKKNSISCVIDNRPKNNYLKELFYQKLVYRGIKVIYVVHSSRQETHFKDKRLIQLFKANFANVCVSEYIEKEILNKNGIENTRTIHNAYNMAYEKLVKENDKPELPNKPYFLFYGRLQNAVKNLTFLLDAFEYSNVWKNGVELLILGNGKDKELLLQKTRGLDCHEFVSFLPYTKNPYPYIANARSVVLTSNYEGFPMVLIEALSLGTPVISLDIISGPSEIIQDTKNGILVPANGKVETFSESMKTMVYDQVFYDSCKQNAATSVERFSMENISRQWRKLLETL